MGRTGFSSSGSPFHCWGRPYNSRSELWWTKRRATGELSIVEGFFLEEGMSKARLSLPGLGGGREGRSWPSWERRGRKRSRQRGAPQWERPGPSLMEVVAGAKGSQMGWARACWGTVRSLDCIVIGTGS